MKVILLKGVQKLGNRFDIVNVADGFAMNSLFPHKLAELATPDAIKRAEKMKSHLDSEKKAKEEVVLKNLKKISDITINIKAKASEQGHLFAGIHKDEIIPAIKEKTDLDIDPSFIVLDKPIKEVGEHKVTIAVGDKSAELTLNISAE